MEVWIDTRDRCKNKASRAMMRIEDGELGKRLEDQHSPEGAIGAERMSKGG